MTNAETWCLSDNRLGGALQRNSSASRILYRKGDAIYDQGERSRYLYVVLSGKCRVTMTRVDGFELLLEVMGPGALMGEGPALEGLPRFSSATAIEESDVLRLSTVDLLAAMARDTDLAAAMLHVMATKQRLIAERLLALTMVSTKSRIAEIIFKLSGSYGVLRDGEMVMSSRLSHEQIASLVGTTRVSVTRAMRELTDEGVLRVKDSIIFIPDVDRLHYVCSF